MENTKAFEYSTEFKFGKEDFAEFSAVNYRHSMRTSLYILLLYVIFNLYYSFRYGFMPASPLFHFACIVFAVIVFLVNSSRMKNATEKEVAHWEKPYREYCITFDEHICVNRDGAVKRYALGEVKKVFKAGSLYCLYLRQKSYIIIKPDSEGQSFPDFVLAKCEKINPKRVIDLKNTKKANKIIFIATLALMALHFALLIVTI